MKNRTEAAITEALWQLLDEKSYSSITVRDIVERCGINRNTFYYHFHDIPELLESVIREDADIVIRECGIRSAPLDCLTDLIGHCLNRKKAMLHIYRSAQREVFVSQLDRICLYVTEQYIEAGDKASEISGEDRQLLIRFYKCLLTGILLDWFNSGMDYDLTRALMRLNELFDCSAAQAFSHAAETAKHKHHA